MHCTGNLEFLTHVGAAVLLDTREEPLSSQILVMDLVIRASESLNGTRAALHEIWDDTSLPENFTVESWSGGFS